MRVAALVKCFAETWGPVSWQGATAGIDARATAAKALSGSPPSPTAWERERIVVALNSCCCAKVTPGEESLAARGINAVLTRRGYFPPDQLYARTMPWWSNLTCRIFRCALSMSESGPPPK